MLGTRSPHLQRQQAKLLIMSKEQDNKALRGRWFWAFWGNL
jgi:hypothetical protein